MNELLSKGSFHCDLGTFIDINFFFVGTAYKRKFFIKQSIQYNSVSHLYYTRQSQGLFVESVFIYSQSNCLFCELMTVN